MSTLSRRDFVQKSAAAGVALASSRAAAESEASAASSQDPWLVMVYLAGDNNLTEDMVLALQDLQAEGPPSGDKIVAQFDPSGVGLFTQRYDFSTPMGPALEDYRDKTYGGAEGNTGSGEALVDFIRWARKKYPQPTRHLLILSGHGSGTTEDFFLSDQSSKDSLTIDELTEGLEGGLGHTQQEDRRSRDGRLLHEHG